MSSQWPRAGIKNPQVNQRDEYGNPSLVPDNKCFFARNIHHWWWWIIPWLRRHLHLPQCTSHVLNAHGLFYVSWCYDCASCMIVCNGLLYMDVHVFVNKFQVFCEWLVPTTVLQLIPVSKYPVPHVLVSLVLIIERTFPVCLLNLATSLYIFFRLWKGCTASRLVC